MNDTLEVVQLTNDLPAKTKEYQETIAELKEKYSGLSLTDLSDKETYLQIKKARIEVKNTRVGVEKFCKAAREKANEYAKTVIAKEKEIVALLNPLEIYLSQEEGKWDAEQERLKQIEIEKENQRIRKRIDVLRNAGMSQTANGFEYTDKYFITELNVKVYDDTAFELFVSNVKLQVQRDEEAKREKERIEQEERERFIKEKEAQEAERKRLDAIRQEQEQKQREIEQREAAIREEQERKERELKAEAERIEAEKRRVVEEKQREEKRLREEAEQKERERIAAEKEAKRIARQPDKKKLQQFAAMMQEALEGALPELKSQEAQDISITAASKFRDVITFINEQANKL